MDTTLVDLIDQGQAQVASNQAAIMDQLAVIIGKQVGDMLSMCVFSRPSL